MKTYSSFPSHNEKTQQISCPLCGSTYSKFHWDCDGFSFQLCKRCKAVYQQDQPLQEEIVKRYDKGYFQYEIENEDDFFSLMEKGLSDIDFFTIEKEIQEKSILDIGCATGRLLSYLKSRGWDVAGAEVCEPSAHFGNKNYDVNIFPGTLAQASYSVNSFSIVHCSHLIEHLAHPVDFLHEVIRVLKPGGFFLCTTPNTAGFQSRWFQERWRSAIADHLVLFNKRNLCDLFKREGLSVLRTKTWGGLGADCGPLWIKRILDPLSKSWGFGDVMLVLAQKPL